MSFINACRHAYSILFHCFQHGLWNGTATIAVYGTASLLLVYGVFQNRITELISFSGTGIEASHPMLSGANLEPCSLG